MKKIIKYQFILMLFVHQIVQPARTIAPASTPRQVSSPSNEDVLDALEDARDIKIKAYNKLIEENLYNLPKTYDLQKEIEDLDSQINSLLDDDDISDTLPDAKFTALQLLYVWRGPFSELRNKELIQLINDLFNDGSTEFKLKIQSFENKADQLEKEILFFSNTLAEEGILNFFLYDCPHKEITFNLFKLFSSAISFYDELFSFFVDLKYPVNYFENPAVMQFHNALRDELNNACKIAEKALATFEDISFFAAERLRKKTLLIDQSIQPVLNEAVKILEEEAKTLSERVKIFDQKERVFKTALKSLQELSKSTEAIPPVEKYISAKEYVREQKWYKDKTFVNTAKFGAAALVYVANFTAINGGIAFCLTNPAAIITTGVFLSAITAFKKLPKNTPGAEENLSQESNSNESEVDSEVRG